MTRSSHKELVDVCWLGCLQPSDMGGGAPPREHLHCVHQNKKIEQRDTYECSKPKLKIILSFGLLLVCRVRFRFLLFFAQERVMRYSCFLYYFFFFSFAVQCTFLRVNEAKNVCTSA